MSTRHCNSYCSSPSSLHILLFSLGLQIPLVQFITSFYPSISPRFSSFLSIRLSEFFGIQWAVKSHKLLLLYVWPCDRKRKRRRREKRDFLLQHFWTFPAPPVITHRHRSTRTAAKLHHPYPPHPSISNPLSSYKPPTPVPTRQHLHHFALESGSLHWTTTRGLESDKTFRHGTASSDKTNTFTNYYRQVSLTPTMVKVWCSSPIFGQTFVNNEASGVFWNYFSINSDMSTHFNVSEMMLLCSKHNIKHT